MTSPSVTQKEAVRRALEALGGVATFGQLNQTAPYIEGSDWSGTKTPFASIRRIVQTSDLFWRVRPGLWALKSEKERIVIEYKIPTQDASTEVVDKFNHAYYQGLLVQLGKLEGHRTSVPAQDKNQLFLKEPLHQLASFTVPPAFTFEHLVRRAKTIDVAWYNERDFPHAFFEVEHSTDISNSLGKFVDFQDFRTKFFIVADELRRKEWKSKMNQSQFAAIKDRVSFLSYEAVGKSYDNAIQKADWPSF